MQRDKILRQDKKEDVFAHGRKRYFFEQIHLHIDQE